MPVQFLKKRCTVYTKKRCTVSQKCCTCSQKCLYSFSKMSVQFLKNVCTVSKKNAVQFLKNAVQFLKKTLYSFPKNVDIWLKNRFPDEKANCVFETLKTFRTTSKPDTTPRLPRIWPPSSNRESWTIKHEWLIIWLLFCGIIFNFLPKHQNVCYISAKTSKI